MLKPIFWTLLAANVALFAYGQGYLGHFSEAEREPARLKNQLNAGKLTPISAAKANAAAAAAAPQASAPAEDRPTACLEIGSFQLADARRFETRVAALEMGDRQSRRNVPGQEASSYMVHIPPQGSKEGADKKAAELRALGISNFFVMPEPPLRWGISLGVFKTEAAAQTQLAALNKQGVHSARIAPRFGGSKLLAYQFRDVSTETRSALEKIAAGFPEQEIRSCAK
ncbi:SPOR domain-containing protein [Massilia endophytica]|uniref:SPOR domain-containing protein n=1 Tax=Massilia endophytica TaxID=2899220 RepID=UPI001E39EC1F|nr:SPOR domain-containing protein [Massilia endophytica]UGQ47019.1 SPOR domain-containing protein [Massilia endophytica]